MQIVCAMEEKIVTTSCPYVSYRLLLRPAFLAFILHRMRERSEPVSFRLSPTFAKQLAKRAATHGESHGTHAKRLVIDALNDTDRERLHAELAELRKLIEASREDYATTFAALLVKLKVASAAEAEAWVRENLLR